MTFIEQINSYNSFFNDKKGDANAAKFSIYMALTGEVAAKNAKIIEWAHHYICRRLFGGRLPFEDDKSYITNIKVDEHSIAANVHCWLQPHARVNPNAEYAHPHLLAVRIGDFPDPPERKLLKLCGLTK